jgi:hypothetical protein
MGIQVLSDEMINNVNVLFSEIDALLAQAETTLTKIDEALAKMEQLVDMMIKYLPDDLLQELKSSQAALELAKDEYDRIKNDPNASETDKAKAKENLKKAREAVKKAYGDAATYWKEALVKFVKILWKATRELGQEAVASFSSKEVLLDVAKKTLDNSNGVQPSNNSFEVMDEENSNSKNVSSTEKNTDNSEQVANSHKENILDYYKKGTNLYVSYTLRLLVETYSTETSLKDFEANLKSKGLNIADFIFKQLRLEKAENLIVELVKQELLFFFIDTTVKK